jgi:predicted secreted protein
MAADMIRTKPRRSLFYLVIIAVAGLIIGFLLTGMTWAPDEATYFDLAQPADTAYLNTSSLMVSQGDLFRVVLPYDQLAGPRWRISVSPGLFIEKERFLPYPEGELVQSDGVIEWYVRAVGTGEEVFTAITRIRSGSLSSEQTRYVLAVDVIRPS